jgi:beta-lactamase class A
LRANRVLGELARISANCCTRAALPPGWTTAVKAGSGDYASTNDVGVARAPALPTPAHY